MIIFWIICAIIAYYILKYDYKIDVEPLGERDWGTILFSAFISLIGGPITLIAAIFVLSGTLIRKKLKDKNIKPPKFL